MFQALVLTSTSLETFTSEARIQKCDLCQLLSFLLSQVRLSAAISGQTEPGLGESAPDLAMSEHASAASMSNGTPPPDERELDLDDFVKPLTLNDSTVHTLAYQFSEVYSDLAIHSDEQFLPTPVTGLPSGHETGQFLAIDVGGTNLRVAFVELLGDLGDAGSSVNGVDRSRETIRNAQRPRVRRLLEKAWPIGEHLKTDQTEDLFAWIGDCIAEVVGDKLVADAGKVSPPKELQMGITFSFPMM